jgi:glucose-6-phosphate 1-dehydrogenase
MSTAAAPRPAIASAPAGGPQTPDVLVVFGISGDLAKVMTFRSLYRLERRKLLGCPIVGVAADDWGVEDLRKRARESIEACGEMIDEEVFKRFAERLSYISGDFADEALYGRVASVLGDVHNPVFYLEIPPFLFGIVVKGLAQANVTKNARVVVEKPFGHDLASAQQLAAEIHQHIDEAQLYRIDHFLGKMGTDEFLYLRFGNTMIEPVWNRNHVACVQITMAEEGGEAPTPYEVLLLDAMRGNSMRFTRQDSVEECWRIFDPLLPRAGSADGGGGGSALPIRSYAPGSWGPQEAERLVAGYGGWHGPWVAS